MRGRGLFANLTFAVFSLGFMAPGHAQVKINGFADIVGSSSSAEYTVNWLGNDGRHLTFDGSTRVGLNLSGDLGNHWDFAGQFVARAFGGQTEQGAYLFNANWLFLTMRPTDNWMFRAGRQILPVFLFSEQIDVGFTYLWARLPTVVYGIIPVKSFNGALGSYKYFYGDMQISASLYGGAGFFETVSPGIGGLSIRDQSVSGGNLALVTENYKFLYTHKRSNPKGSYYFPAPPGGPWPVGAQVDSPLDLGWITSDSLGVDVNIHKFRLISEAQKSTNVGTTKFNLTGYYVTAAYQLYEGWLTPHLTYGRQWDKTTVVSHPDRSLAFTKGAGAFQEQMSQGIVGLNMRASNSLVIKFEYETAKLEYADSSLNFGVDTYTIALDAVF